MVDEEYEKNDMSHRPFVLVQSTKEITGQAE